MMFRINTAETLSAARRSRASADLDHAASQHIKEPNADREQGSARPSGYGVRRSRRKSKVRLPSVADVRTIFPIQETKISAPSALSWK